MTNILEIIQTRARTADGFELRRALPAPTRKMVGPFIFFDHVGPVDVTPEVALDVRPHPHIHLSTVTYMLEGEIVHRDSLGIEQRIAPGAINWMTAGRGIVHSERTPAATRQQGTRMHVLQLWVALPKSHEEIDPSFVHHPSSTLPELEDQNLRLRVLAGEAYGARSPVNVLSPLFYVEATLDAGARLELPTGYSERGAYVVEGDVVCGSTPLPPHALTVFAPKGIAVIEARTKARVMLLGGEPFEEPRYIFWNFASSSQDRIRQAAEDWRAGRFPTVPGDDKEFIPLTDMPRF